MRVVDPFVIRPLEGYSPRIGELVVMMHYARASTIHAVVRLTTEELDARPHGVTNSIGMLAAHIAAVEAWYQAHTFEGRDDPWDSPAQVLGEPGQQQLKGRDGAHYAAALSAIREKTLAGFAARDDEWLMRSTSFWGGRPANNYFKWFHVFEDELGHCGQIRLLRKMLQLT